MISGECYARLDKVGEDSYISKLTLEAKAMNSEEQSEMIRVLEQISWSSGYIDYSNWTITFWTAVFLFGSIF